jgi:hypothetical protein
MASFFDSRIFSQLAGAAGEVTRERARTYDQQFRKSGADALEVGQQLLGLFEQLPAAMIASERAEYERLVKRYGEEHPRATDASEILTGLESFESQAALGRARVRRAVESMQAPGVAFFGFVFDESGKPLGGLTVRVSQSARSQSLQARTPDDRYFRIPLVQDPRGLSAARERASAHRIKSAATQPGQRVAASSAMVEIVDARAEVVHQDPVPLNLTGGNSAESVDGGAKPTWARLSDSVYREYRIGPVRKEPHRAPKRNARA